MDDAKIRLSEEEAALVRNSAWILTKNDILEKVKQLLGRIQVRQKVIVDQYKHRLPSTLSSSSPKISKGEQYQGLPYLVLDWPRDFGKDGSWAIRTLFWWGHYFTVTLHLSGKYREQLRQQVIGQVTQLAAGHFLLATGDDEWQHHLTGEHYTPVKSFDRNDFEKAITVSPFLKITWQLSLDQWDDAEEKLIEAFKVLLDAGCPLH